MRVLNIFLDDERTASMASYPLRPYQVLHLLPKQEGNILCYDYENDLFVEVPCQVVQKYISDGKTTPFDTKVQQLLSFPNDREGPVVFDPAHLCAK